VARTSKKNAEKTIPIHSWKRVSGKHHRRGKPTIKPGDTIEAPAGTYANDPQWQDLGQVGSEPAPAPASPPADVTLVKEEVEGGFNVINPATGEPVNDNPLSEEEAEELINASLDRS